jgi:hypothetical protein
MSHGLKAIAPRIQERLVRAGLGFYLVLNAVVISKMIVSDFVLIGY